MTLNTASVTGTGESGKSTVCKQMKIIHIDSGFTDEYVRHRHSVSKPCHGLTMFVSSYISPTNHHVEIPVVMNARVVGSMNPSRYDKIYVWITLVLRCRERKDTVPFIRKNIKDAILVSDVSRRRHTSYTCSKATH